MKRTDIHRPSAINPEEYEYVGIEVIKIEGMGDVYAMQHYRERIKAHMARTGGTYSGHAHGGNCMICGNAFAHYTILFYHWPTKSYVRAGKDCADKLEYSHSEYNAFTAAIRDAREAQTGKRKAQATLEDAGIPQAWQIAEAYKVAADRPTRPSDEQLTRQQEDAFYRAIRKWDQANRDAFVVNDIVNKLIKYGSISDKSMGYLKILVDRIAKKPEIEAQRAAERSAAADCPMGRTTVTGTILSVKDHESDFGLQLKMLVKADEGYVVYVTVPSWLKAERDVRVTFKATLTPSDDDPKFGFGKRPTLISASNATTLEETPVSAGVSTESPVYA